MTTVANTNPLAERVAALERELETERRHLATRADIAELKAWLVWRIVLIVAVLQGLFLGVLQLLQFLR